MSWIGSWLGYSALFPLVVLFGVFNSIMDALGLHF